MRREVGLPSAEILAEEGKFDLTLLGKRTYFHFETQADEDETLEVVLRRSHHPVVAVPMKLPAPAPVVVAYDASPAAGRALAAFPGSGLYEGQAVHVVSVARGYARTVVIWSRVTWLLPTWSTKLPSRTATDSTLPV